MALKLQLVIKWYFPNSDGKGDDFRWDREEHFLKILLCIRENMWYASPLMSCIFLPRVRIQREPTERKNVRQRVQAEAQEGPSPVSSGLLSLPPWL